MTDPQTPATEAGRRLLKKQAPSPGTGYDPRFPAHRQRWADAITAIEHEAADWDVLTGVLTVHYITAIDCDHEAQTDTVRCNCSVWTGTPQPSIGDAVQEWIAHVIAHVAATPAGAV